VNPKSSKQGYDIVDVVVVVNAEIFFTAMSFISTTRDETDMVPGLPVPIRTVSIALDADATWPVAVATGDVPAKV